MAPSALQSEAAQLHVVSWFRQYFLGKFPSGIVISELEYMGRTTSATEAPTPLRTFGQPRLNEVLDALAHDFRRWSKDRDYRKCDVLGIANDGFNAELVEVTTENNAASAIAQVNSKLAILRETVNRIHNLSVDWRASMWKPAPHQLFRMLTPTPLDITCLCYVPTFVHFVINRCLGLQFMRWVVDIGPSGFERCAADENLTDRVFCSVTTKLRTPSCWRWT